MSDEIRVAILTDLLPDLEALIDTGAYGNGFCWKKDAQDRRPVDIIEAFIRSRLSPEPAAPDAGVERIDITTAKIRECVSFHDACDILTAHTASLRRDLAAAVGLLKRAAAPMGRYGLGAEIVAFLAARKEVPK